MRLQRATGKGRIFHDDLHAFRSGGILFVNNGALRKERVSDGILFANSSKKYEKMPPETDGFWTSFTFKRLACYGTVKELTQQQTRCRSRSGEENISFTAGSTDSPGRTVSFFN